MSWDSAKTVTEICRRNAFNGHFSKWCLSCALGLGGFHCAAATYAKEVAADIRKVGPFGATVVIALALVVAVTLFLLLVRPQ